MCIRDRAECDQITELVGRERLIEITANPALTGFTASKVRWVKNHQPEIFEKTRKVLLPKDYVRYRLTGEYASEVSDASGMQFLDVPKRTWSREVLEKLGIPYDWMPAVYESQEVSGKVTRAVAAVSYTHLDVYKRQAQRCPGRSTCTPTRGTTR